MYKMIINQLTNGITLNDAVSKQVIAIKKCLEDLGIESSIFVYWKDEKIKEGSVFSIYENTSNLPPKLLKSDIVIYHHYNKSHVIEVLKKLSCQKILYYHNITPPSFFKDSDPKMAEDQQIGLNQMEILKSLCDSAAGSIYNVVELKKMGFSSVYEVPYYFDMKLYSKKNQRVLENKKVYDNIIFVGRIAPNKRQDDLIKIFYYYTNFVNPNSRLFITGQIDQNNPDLYQANLLVLIRNLGLENKVIFTGLINQKELLSLYRMADIFVCMSEHEGFCVPIIESMLMKVPVIAFDSTAIPYTMKNAGILINKKEHKLIALLIKKILNDKSLQSKLISEQLEFAKNEYGYEKFKKSLVSLVKIPER